MDWNDGRGPGDGGSCSLARAKACVVPAVSGEGMDAGGIGGATEATRMRVPAAALMGGAEATVTGGGKGGAAIAAAVPIPFEKPPCATATLRAESR